MMSQTWGTNQHYHLAGRIQEPRIFFFPGYGNDMQRGR